MIVELDRRELRHKHEWPTRVRRTVRRIARREAYKWNGWKRRRFLPAAAFGLCALLRIYTPAYALEVHATGGIMGASSDLRGTGSQTDTFNTHGSFTETTPAGFTHLVIEIWGASGGGGGGPIGGNGGSGGGSGGYSRSATIGSITSGKTINVTVGQAGAQGSNATPSAGSAGTATSVTSGTLTITTQTANGGGGGAANGGAAGTGGTASGGSVNTTGNNGVVGAASGGAGGAGIVGQQGSGGDGGKGGINLNPPNIVPTAGNDGLAIFFYTP